MKTILVIEDEAYIRENIRDILELEGFAVVVTPDGKAGLEQAQQESFDLIVCDIMMPNLNGYEVLDQLRQTPQTQDIPLIFLSAKAEHTNRRQGMELGADDYLTKPFTASELLGAVNARLRRQETLLHLQQRISELQQSNLLKDDFLSVASHELRSPMANILMAVRVLQEIPDPSKQQHYLNILQTECNRELNLINDLLDLQRLQMKMHQSYPEPIYLQSLIPELVETFNARITDDHQHLEIDLPDDFPPLIADQADLQRIFSELLNNACKYTPVGRTIRLHFATLPQPLKELPNGQEPQGPHATIAVSNQAEIPKVDLPHIFEKFYRAAQVDTKRRGGTGLGLSLVGKLVEHLGGTIEVNSGNGWTTFILHLPLQTVQPPRPETDKIPDSA